MLGPLVNNWINQGKFRTTFGSASLVSRVYRKIRGGRGNGGRDRYTAAMNANAANPMTAIQIDHFRQFTGGTALDGGIAAATASCLIWPMKR
jgi:hypothetical protein